MSLEHLTDMEKQANEVLRQYINTMESDPTAQVKVARATSDFVRIKMREDGLLRKILPGKTITGDDLNKRVDTDKPSKIVELEPDSPAAFSMPFGQFPESTYIHGKRVLVTFSRIATNKFSKDVAELHDYDLDIRQVISDNSLKDMLAEEDGKAIQTLNSMLSGDAMTSGQSLPYGPNGTNIVLWRSFLGGMTRENVIEAKKIMMNANSRLRPQTCLVNQKTALEFEKWTREEVGGDMSQQMLVNGWADQASKWASMNWITTIKDDLVPDGTAFMFAAPEFLGRLYFLEDVTMFVKREGPMLSWYSYELIGGCFCNPCAVSRVDFS